MTKLYFPEPEAGGKSDQDASRTEEGPPGGPRPLCVFTRQEGLGSLWGPL